MTDIWHMDAPQAIAVKLKTDLLSGLTEAEALHRLNEYGLNELTKQKIISPFKIFLQQFNSLVIWVLLGAVAISFLLNEKVDAIAIFSIVILNAIIGFVLEYRADRAIQALQQMAAPTATVVRDGHSKVIRASHIVCGDILLFESGDLIAADARLVDVASLKANEAPLTGESLPIEKNLQSYPEQIPLADRKNMVFMGTAVANGTGRAIVVSTGMQTEMGHIAKMLGEASRDETPLQTKLNQVGKRLLLVCFAIIISIFTLGLIRGIPLLEIFMSSVSLAVAAIPEGMPAVVTVALALGVQRMVRRDVLVRRLSAVETMGCLQVICTDKTGTLTVGEMTARKLVTGEEIYVIQGEGYHVSGGFLRNDIQVIAEEDYLLLEVLRAIALCNNAEITMKNNKLSIVGDPTEVAMLVASAKAGLRRESLEPLYPRILEFPFNSQRKRMSVVCQTYNEYTLFVKGAPEVILERCTHINTKEGIKKLDINDRARIQQSCKLMASEALRVLAVAERAVATLSIDDNIENDLILLGLIGLQDPPHAEAKESVHRCKTAGIKPVMITGDHPDTARAIAEELGILTGSERLITGAELEKMSDDEFSENVREISVYARVTAENKLKIVRAWKSHHMVVAMTGDGVNDAPALKESSVGIAMGKTGAAVTKEVADVIVLDNNFSSIVAGIEEGRIIYDNIAKSLKYLLAGSVAELMVVFTALLINWPLPLLPIQLLWINLVTDGLPAIALATDISDSEILKRPPRNESKPFIDTYFIRRIIFVGFLTATVTLFAFGYEYIGDGDLVQARDAAFSVLVVAGLLRAFGMRSDTKTAWEVGLLTNLRLFLVISVSFSLQLFIHHTPILQQIFKIEPVSMSECFSWVALGSVPLIVLEITKLIRNKESDAVKIE